MKPMKQLLLAQFARDPVVGLLRPVRPRAATIFCFHRFADAATGIPGHDPAALRRNLAFVRRHRLHVVPLADLIATLETGDEPRPGTVVFTIDDGYADFVNIAAPIFAEFDCPTTVFLVSGFVDGSIWLWWDQIEYMFRETKRMQVALDLEGQPFRSTWTTPLEAIREAWRLAEMLESVSETSKQCILIDLATQLEVSPPARAPAPFAAMTWEDVRRCERMGVTFGPHTVTHPILSRVDDASAVLEVRASWARVRAETAAAVPVFCYPNGSASMFGAREVKAVKECGLRAAVTTTPRHVTQKQYSAAPDAPFLLPRLAYFDELPQFAQMVSGVEWVKSIARSLTPAGRRAR
jgi:peptidoglycan/xylan/chitin deacetylase (PgdA/CDA1 family)